MTRAKVVVAVPTYQRPELLERCLRSVVSQAAGEVSFEVVVVDNDPGQSAMPVVRRVEQVANCRLTYVVEPQRGVSAARNRAIQWADGAALLAFIDDDEWADVGWLDALLERRAVSGAAVIQGSVTTFVVEGGPVWASHPNGPFRNRCLDESRPPSTAAANNVLIDLRRLAQTHHRFDYRFGLVGGEDTEFFARLRQSGLLIVAAPEARVFEDVPLERQTLSWVWSRRFRSAATWVVVEREVIRPRRLVIRRLGAAARDAWEALVSGLAWVFGRSPVRAADAVEMSATAAGTVSAVFGLFRSKYMLEP